MQNSGMGKRITVTLSDTAMRLVREYAESHGVSLSRAVNELIVRGYAAGRADSAEPSS